MWTKTESLYSQKCYSMAGMAGGWEEISGGVKCYEVQECEEITVLDSGVNQSEGLTLQLRPK